MDSHSAESIKKSFLSLSFSFLMFHPRRKMDVIYKNSADNLQMRSSLHVLHNIPSEYPFGRLVFILSSPVSMRKNSPEL